MAGGVGSARQIADDLWLLDTRFQGEPGVIASYLIVGREGHALVDVGSGATVEHLLDAVRESGHDPEDITRLLITHVHLDHAGATGALIERLPRARAVVHEIGAPHLIDPSKLVASAARIYGARMVPLWGEMRPVPEDRLDRIGDGGTVRVGKRELTALYTPGHAVHHIALHDAARREAFTGDVAGVRLEGAGYVRPPTPPPDLNLELWNQSLDRLAALDLSAIYLPHFGRVTDVAPHLREVSARLAAWGELLLPGIRTGASDETLAQMLADASDPDVAAAAGAGHDAAETVRRYEIATNYLMSAQGYVRYYRKHHPELLAE